jgi:hypothetical protein
MSCRTRQFGAPPKQLSRHLAGGKDLRSWFTCRWQSRYGSLRLLARVEEVGVPLVLRQPEIVDVEPFDPNWQLWSNLLIPGQGGKV